MVFRILVRFFTSNEQLIRHLSQTYAIRQIARAVVKVFNRGREITEETGIKDNLHPVRIKSAVQRFTKILKEDLNEFKNEFKKKQ